MNNKERFINACQMKEVDRPPVWMMRQAGRYMPEYMAIKAKHPTIEMMQTPELACEITLQPVKEMGVDAAILYSDILMIPDALGMGLSFEVGEGPKFKFGIQSQDDLNKLNTNDILSGVDYVYKSIELIIKELPDDFPLLGFAGAPFTVACYMISGKGRSDFSEVKTLAWTQPKVFHALMELLTQATTEYLIKQVDAGVVAVQLFDTWAGLLSPYDYEQLAAPYTQKIFQALREQNINCIHYIKSGDFLLPQMAKMPNNVMGVDWRVDLKTIRDRTHHKYAIQGNFDPDLLRSHPDVIVERTKKMLTDIPDPKKGYIVNLGHGIHKDTPVENAKLFIQTVKNHFK